MTSAVIVAGYRGPQGGHHVQRRTPSNRGAECQRCRDRKARFRYRGVVRADRDHTFCFACYRREVNRARARRLWARPDFAQAVDVLFVDEAGQMSLANVLAVAQAAGSVVLLGDPQQLEQPKKGSHPEGVNASTLQHILGECLTIPADRGIFLPTTRRLAPSICAFTSELFYEGRLSSEPGRDRQQLTGGPFTGSGLWVVEVDHQGNRNASDEEVEAVADLVGRLTAPGSQWIDEDGVAKQLTGNGILIVAPYNAQVSRLDAATDETGQRAVSLSRTRACCVFTFHVSDCN